MNINEYLKKIGEDFEKQLSEIPEQEIKAFLDRAYHDTHELFKENEQNDFKRVTYVIYRSYILGMLIERMRNKSKFEVIKNNPSTNN